MKVKKSMVAMALAVGLAAGAGATTDAQAGGNNDVPSASAIAFAERTSNLMTATTFAALVQEIGETTPANVAEGSLSIGLIFDDGNLNLRLVGDLDPLSDNDYPRDDFEEYALSDALVGAPRVEVERVSGKWYYRRSIPLSNFVPQCALCHANFAPMSSTEWVGALMLRVPIPSN
jgi:hypothetical protein